MVVLLSPISLGHLVGLLLVVQLSAIKCTLIKLAVAKRDVGAQNYASSCNDWHIVDKATLSFPAKFSHLNKPWDSPNVLIVGRSTTVTNSMTTLLTNSLVPGLNGSTVADVMNTLRRDPWKCLTFPFGGSVRDQFLIGAVTKDIDMEVSCSPEVILDACRSNWPGKCIQNANPIVHIGEPHADEAIDAADWYITFFGNYTYLEYTTNSLAYDSNPGSTQTVFDLSGRGVPDTCSKVIEIAAPRSSSLLEWNAWKKGFGAPEKVYRFWKLRVKGYTATTDTRDFIVNATREFIEQNPSLFQTFHCGKAMHGKYNDSERSCSVKSCATAEANSANYLKFYKEDMGDLFPTVDQLVKEIKLHCTTTSSAGNGSSVKLDNELTESCDLGITQYGARINAMDSR